MHLADTKNKLLKDLSKFLKDLSKQTEGAKTP